MGSLYSYTYISLDGVMSSPETWTSAYWSEAMNNDLTRRLTDCAAMVLGRNSYNDFAGFWPQQGSDVPFADLNNHVRKYVVSHTLKDPEWRNSTVMSAAELVQRRSEGDLHITGSQGLIVSLLDQRLLDEMVLMVCPIVLGEGQRLFDGVTKVGMDLVETTQFPNGVLCLRLNPAA
jgi:dihydrofolate reductase